MSNAGSSTPSVSEGRRESWILVATGAAALAPYLIYHRLFLQLFWFGDEFDLIDQIDRLGLWKWVWMAFAENFVPLFKSLWGGSVLLSGGSYAFMIAIVWVTHAANVALLGRLMRTCGLSWCAVLFAQVVFGLSVENLETLAWSVQWSAMLSVTFMLLGLDRIFRSVTLRPPLVYTVASGLSFSRGALTGPILGCAYFLLDTGSPFVRRCLRASVFLLPAVAVAGLIFALANGNQHAMGGHMVQAAVFGLWYFCLNPIHQLLLVESWGWRTTIIIGALKVGLLAWSVARSKGPARVLFMVLVLFDLANAALLGIGRYHTGLPSTVSSRYQYASMIAVLPMAGFWLSHQWRRVTDSWSFLSPAYGIALAVLAVVLCRQWPDDLVPFAQWRGADSRQVLFIDSNPDSRAVPGIPGLPMDRAKELIARYHLH
jgi:hypothetical protein